MPPPTITPQPPPQRPLAPVERLPAEILGEVCDNLTPFERTRAELVSKPLRDHAVKSWVRLVPPRERKTNDAKSDWVADFHAQYPSVQSVIRREAASRVNTPHFFKAPVFDSFARLFQSEVFVADDNNLVFFLKDRVCGDYARGHRLTYVAFWSRADSAMAYQLADHESDLTVTTRTWTFANDVTVDRTRILRNQFADTIRMKDSKGRAVELKKASPDLAAAIERTHTFVALSAVYRVEYMARLPEGRYFRLDTPKYASDSRNSRAYFGTPEAMRRVAVSNIFRARDGGTTFVHTEAGVLFSPTTWTATPKTPTFTLAGSSNEALPVQLLRAAEFAPLLPRMGIDLGEDHQMLPTLDPSE